MKKPSSSTPPKTHLVPTCSSPTVTPELAALIDELGAIDEELAPLKPKITRAESLRKAIGAQIADPAAAEKLDGLRFSALVGPKQNERFIRSMPALFKLVGKSQFLEMAKVTLKAVEEAVKDAGALAGIIDCARIGPRTVQTYRKAK